MALTVIGLNHQGAALEIRELVAYRPSERGDALARLRTAAGAREGVLLSTCNRTEFYLVDPDGAAEAAAWSLLSARLGEDATRYGYVRRDRDTVSHLFRVAAGLDSMILGEAQIHGQVREAWEASRGHTGAVLNRLFQTALQVAGRLRAETAIGRGAASVPSAAVQLAKQIFGSLAGRRAMVLGAGDMADLALECLASEGVQTTIVANRTFDRARALAERHGARAAQYEECWSALEDVDLLLCSTAAPQAVVTTRRVAGPGAGRGDRPLCILDVALPRDVEPAVAKLGNVFLYDLDDLQRVVAGSLERRRGELPAAERLIATEAERFWQWLGGLAAVPVLTQMRGEMERLRVQELEEALRRLAHLSPQDRAVVEQLSRAIMNKFLHQPTVRLRAAAASEGDLAVLAAARYLFGLDQTEARADGAAPASWSETPSAGDSPAITHGGS